MTQWFWSGTQISSQDAVFQIRDRSGVNDLTKKASWPDRWHISVQLNITKKKLACDLGDPSDGLQDPPLERINWNTEDGSQDSP